MASPSPLYALLKNGLYLTVTGMLSETRRDFFNFDQTNYRDDFQTPIDATLVTFGISTAPPGADPYIIKQTEEGVLTTETVIGNSKFPTDPVMHIPPRNTRSRRTMLRWWDDANHVEGVAGTISATTISGSGVLTMWGTDHLHPGQTIVGTGVPAGTVIVAILSPTTIAISRVASASATVSDLAVGAGSGGSLLGECWLDRFIGWSSAKPGR